MMFSRLVQMPFDAAYEKVQSLRFSPRPEQIPLKVASHRILLEAAVARVDVPPFPRAMMDGYAIRAEDLAASDVFHVVGIRAAGDDSQPSLGRQEAYRIATGSAIPEGADSIARFEWCKALDTQQVRVLRPISAGESVQPVGEDTRAGQVALSAGVRLNGRSLAMCVSFGIHTVTVAAPISVALVITGSELIADVTKELAYGQIYGTNDIFLQETLALDGCEVVSVAYVGDDEVHIERAVAEASSVAQCVLITGGASAGDFDFVPSILERMGCQLHVQKVWMRPGSPFYAATLGETRIFALSGNPAANYIQFETLVRPVLRLSMGIQDKLFPDSVKLVRDLSLKAIKPVRFLRATATVRAGEIWADTDMSQSPGVMSSFAVANCLLRLDQHQYQAQDVVPMRWLS